MKNKILSFLIVLLILMMPVNIFASETNYVNETPFQIKEGYSYFYGYSTLVNRHYIYEMPNHENGIYVKERYFLKGDTEVSSYNWITANSYYLVGSAFESDSTVNSYMSGFSFTGRYPAFESNISASPEAFAKYINGTPEVIPEEETPVEDLPWYKNIFATINGMFGGLLDGLTGVFGGMADGLASMATSLSNGFSSLGTALGNLWQSVLDIPDRIADGTRMLFDPNYASSENMRFAMVSEASPADQINEVIELKFPIILDLQEAVNSIDVSGMTGEPPNFNAVINGQEFQIIDFTWYEPYRKQVNDVLVAFAWLWFTISMYKRLPSIVGGFRGDLTPTQPTVSVKEEKK